MFFLIKIVKLISEMHSETQWSETIKYDLMTFVFYKNFKWLILKKLNIHLYTHVTF